MSKLKEEYMHVGQRQYIVKHRMVTDPSGWIMVFTSKTSASEYSGPPQGGLRKTTSALKDGATWR
jgi:hypothetical protein